MSIFTQHKEKRPNRNSFDLSHEKKLSFNMGSLIPILNEEVVPSDEFSLNTEVMIRFSPLLAPVMHRVNVYTHYFFVPMRLIWSHWEKFITGGEDGSTEVAVPTLSFSNVYAGELSDYLGLPDGDGSVFYEASMFHHQAYQLIYNEYYRDQNLTEPIDILKDHVGPMTVVEQFEPLLQLRKRCWEKDYFTSALPWTQRGQDVTIPMTGEAPVHLTSGDRLQQMVRGADGSLQNTTLKAQSGALMNESGGNIWLDPNGSMSADMSNVTSGTINDLRRAVKLQEFFEKAARGGSRYVEQILSYFGVKSSDARLQRPQYLGGGKTPVQISEVLQTSQGTAESPQGSMSGHAIAVGNSHRFKHRFEEHGIVMGIMSVMPRTNYQQGLPRKFSRNDRYDYYWPQFAHIGEQAILNQELCIGTAPLGDTFGYAPRYSEYKYCPSTVHGDFKTNLSYWHMGRIFDPVKPPTLSDEFVSYDNSVERCFAIQDPQEQKLWAQVYHNFQAKRPMPYFGTPSF